MGIDFGKALPGVLLHSIAPTEFPLDIRSHRGWRDVGSFKELRCGFLGESNGRREPRASIINRVGNGTLPKPFS